MLGHAGARTASVGTRRNKERDVHSQESVSFLQLHSPDNAEDREIKALDEPFERTDDGKNVTSKCFYVIPHDEDLRKVIASHIHTYTHSRTRTHTHTHTHTLTHSHTHTHTHTHIHTLHQQRTPKVVLEVSSLGFRLVRPGTDAPFGVYSWGQIHSWAHSTKDFAFRHFDERCVCLCLCMRVCMCV